MKKGGAWRVGACSASLTGTRPGIASAGCSLISGAATSGPAASGPAASLPATAAAQVKKALEVTKELGGQGYTFWGGREGYQNLWNTNMKRELEHLARFLHMAVDYAKEIGFTGQFYIEPKPKEPTKHQYDSDAAACLNFLRQYDLLPHLKLNLETNHATLAGHTMQHELETAGSAGARWPGAWDMAAPMVLFLASAAKSGLFRGQPRFFGATSAGKRSRARAANL